MNDDRDSYSCETIAAVINHRGEWIFGKPGDKSRLGNQVCLPEGSHHAMTYEGPPLIMSYDDPDVGNPSACPQYTDSLLCDAGLQWHCDSKFVDLSLYFVDEWCSNGSLDHCRGNTLKQLCEAGESCFCPWNVQRCKNGDRRFCCKDTEHCEDSGEFCRKSDDGLSDSEIEKLYAEAEKAYHCDAGMKQYCSKDLARQRCEGGDRRFCEDTDAKTRCNSGDQRYCAESFRVQNHWNAKAQCDAGVRQYCETAVATKRCEAGDLRFCEDEIALKRCKGGELKFCKKASGFCELFSLHSGRRIHSFDLTGCGGMSGDVIPVATRDSGGSWGFMNLQGEMVVPAQFTHTLFTHTDVAHVKLSRADAQALCGTALSNPQSSIDDLPWVCQSIGGMEPFVDRETIYGMVDLETGTIRWHDDAAAPWSRGKCGVADDCNMFMSPRVGKAGEVRHSPADMFSDDIREAVENYRACVRGQRRQAAPVNDHEIQTLCSENSKLMQGILTFCLRKDGWEWVDIDLLDEGLCEDIWRAFWLAPIEEAVRQACRR